MHYALENCVETAYSPLTVGKCLTIKYTILLTEKAEGGNHVSIPGLPDCPIEADNRDDVIRLAREAIAAIMSRSEVVQVDVPNCPKLL
jgi:hypothetical protein